MRPRKLVPVAAGLTLLLAAAACTSSSSTTDNSAPAPKASGAALSLKGVCPDNVVIQTDWFPESEYGTFTSCSAPATRSTRRRRSCRPAGRLRPGHRCQGGDPQRRPGDRLPAGQRADVRGQVDHPRPGLHRRGDPELQVPADPRGRRAAGDQPDHDPLDKEEHPDFNTIADIGQTNTKILYYETDAYMQYLLGAGLVRASQLDGSYDGTPPASSPRRARSRTPASPPRSRTSSRTSSLGAALRHAPAADQRHRLPDVRRGAVHPGRPTRTSWRPA